MKKKSKNYTKKCIVHNFSRTSSNNIYKYIQYFLLFFNLQNKTQSKISNTNY